jgi:hypothetical protein
MSVRTNAAELSALIARLGLTDEETLEIFAVDPLSLISGELDHRPELPILGVLTAAAAEQAGESGLHRWMRAAGPAGRPVDMLLAGDFAGFEDALGTLADRGLVLRSGTPPATRTAGRPDAAERRPPGRHGETGGL